jgi:aryl-alcohol dehydrogenase-like predicted oxidoreductase
MKVLGASRYLSPRAGLTAERLIRFALSQPITTAIVGCSTAEEVKTLAGIGKTFHPLTNDEHHEIVKLFRPYARQLAYYRGAI